MKVKAQDSISARELWRDMLQFLRQARLPYLLIVLATVIALARSKIALLIPSYMQQFYAGDFSTHIILLLIGTIALNDAKIPSGIESGILITQL